MRRTGLAHGQGMKLAVSSAPKARKVFVSHPRTGRRALLGIQATHLPCAKWSFWWVIFREQTWVTSRERRSLVQLLPLLLQRFRRRTHIQIPPPAPLQVLVVAERESQKVQTRSFFLQIHHPRFLPIDLQS